MRLPWLITSTDLSSRFLRPVNCPASNLEAGQFTDINVNAGVTYYYALTSVSPAGVEGMRVSENVNVTILFAPSGGTAAISDGTRFTASARAISDDPTLFTAISIELPSADAIVPLRGAVDGTARLFAATSQSGSPFTDLFALPAKIALPYPADTKSPEELQVFFLDNDKWSQLGAKVVDVDLGVITVDVSRFGAYQLAEVVEQPWDVNTDGRVDIFDLVTVGGHFGESGPGITGDVNGDGVVNIVDLVLAGSHFGEVYNGTVAAPPSADWRAQTEVSMTARHSTQMQRGVREQHLTVEINLDFVPSSRSAGLSPDPRIGTQFAGFMFDMEYNPYLLTVVNVQEGALLKRDGGRSFWLKPKFQPGRIARVASAALAEVVPMCGWTRSMWYDQTGLPWVPPSPNMPTLETATLYPGVCLIEGTNLSEGRGTTKPFEWIGAPWLKAEKWAETLNDLSIPGVRFRPIHFTPTFSKYANEGCHGVQIHIMDRETAKPTEIALHLISTALRDYPDRFEFRQSRGRSFFDLLAGTDTLRLALMGGESPIKIVQSPIKIVQGWQADVDAFANRRNPYLLYV